jgi:hypothetical protein
MSAAAPAFCKRPGVSYALTTQGQELPVIDVSHPDFRVADDQAAIESARRAHARMERRGRRIPRFLLRYLWRSMLRRSLLARTLFAPELTVLPGMSTYLMKLGAGNLVPPFDTRTERRLAASPGILSIRLRLQQSAQLLAQGLQASLASDPGATLHLLNIGGGSAIDSLNALILLRRSAVPLLQRPVTVHVLDPDANGPSFGARALAALVADGGALAGLDARVSHHAYDWNDTGPLQQLMHSLQNEHAIIAASSEGALFEYGSDAAIRANLIALHADGRGARVVAGSVTRNDEVTRRSLALSSFRLVPRGAAVFGALLSGTGYSIARVEESLISDQVLLRPD